MSDRTDLASLIYLIEARTAKMEKDWDRAVDKTDSGARRVEQRVGRMTRNLEQRLGGMNIDRALGSVFDATRLRVLDTGIARVGLFGEAFGHLGKAGLFAAGAVVATAVAFQQAKQAMNFADQLADTADRLHVTTDTLQEYRYALRLAGGEEKKADEALEGFSVTLGKAQAGQAKALKFFEALGFTKAQVKSFKDVESGLDAVVSKISGLKSDLKKDAAISGLGLDGLKPLIQAGADEMHRLRDEAHKLGVVMDAGLVRRGAEAQDNFETLSQVVRVQLMSAFVDLGPVLVGLLNMLAGMAKIAREIADAFRTIEDRSSAGLEGEIGKANAWRGRQIAIRGADYFAPAMAGVSAGSSDGLSGLQLDFYRKTMLIREKRAELDKRAAVAAPAVPGAGDLNLAGEPTGPTDAEKLRRGLDALASAQQDELRARADLTKNIDDLAALKGQELAGAAARDVRRLRDEITEGKISKAEAEQAIAIIEKTALLKQEAIDLNRFEDKFDATRAETEKELALYQEITRLRGEIATTAARRLALELEGLAAARGGERVGQQIELEKLLESGSITPEQADERKRRLRERQGLERDAVMSRAAQDVAGRLETFIGSIREKGLWRTAADNFSDRLKENLLRMAALNILKTAGGDSQLGQIANFGLQLMGYAGGGRPAPGVPYLVGEEGPEIRVDGPGTIHPNSALKSLSGPQSISPRGQAVYQQISVDLRGAVVWETALAEIRSYADQAATQAGQGAFEAAKRVIPQRMRRTAETAIR